MANIKNISEPNTKITQKSTTNYFGTKVALQKDEH